MGTPTLGPTQTRPRSRARRALGMAIATGVVAVSLTGCTANEALFFDLPTPASREGEIVKGLWEGSWIAAWAVGILTWGLMIFAAVAYRRRRGRPEVPAQTRYNIPIEVLYTVAPLIMILGLFVFTARDQSDIMTIRNDEAHTVNVLAYRWAWAFNYLDEDVYSTGTSYDGSRDELATLVVPVNQKIRFELTSPDVIHSFWVPDWLFKMDVVPGRNNTFELTPTRTGTFIGRCAELCGNQHALMLFNVKVVEQAEYDAWIQGLRDKGQTGKISSSLVVTDGEIPGEPLV